MSLIIPIDEARRKKLQEEIDRSFGYRNYHDDDVEVRNVGEAGAGVFAVRQFLPGELILEIHGQLFRKSNYEGSTYVMELDNDWYLEPTIPGAFLNHSCNPNSELVQLSKFSMGLIAICNIEEGTQVTFDYRWEAFDWIPKCQCGAPNCRGWVVAEEEVEKMNELAKKKRKRRKKRD